MTVRAPTQMRASIEGALPSRAGAEIEAPVPVGSVRLAAAQLPACTDDLGLNRAVAAEAVRAAAAGGARIVALPELATLPYFCVGPPGSHRGWAEPADGALVATDPADSLRQAEAVEARLRAGERPPLAGVPVAVKDAIWVEGWRVTQGSRLFADFRAPRDNVAVARLRRAGAIVVGMANMSEFGCKGVTSNPLHGTTRHPLDGRLTPGGSSGGCAAALGAGLVPLALGTDGGGSARRPAAHVGAVGFKPSGGLVADAPGFAGGGSLTSVLAPMARSVADAAALFDAILGPDAADPSSCGWPDVPRIPARGLRIAFSPTFSLPVPVDPDVSRCIARAAARLAGAGFDLRRADPAWPGTASEAALMPLQWAGLARLHGEAWRRDPTPFDPYIGAQIERGLAQPPAAVEAACAAAAGIAAALGRFFRDHDLVIGPTTPLRGLGARPARPGRDRRPGRARPGPRGLHALLQPCPVFGDLASRGRRWGRVADRAADRRAALRGPARAGPGARGRTPAALRDGVRAEA